MHRWKVVVRRMVSTMRAKQWALFIVGFLEPQSAFKDFFFSCSFLMVKRVHISISVIDRYGYLFPKMGIYYGKNEV